jgi:predicted XRE-type DNA-binding protein
MPKVNSVFEDLGFDEAEAARLNVMSDLLTMIREEIASEGWTQTQAASRLRWHQPRVSDLLAGKLHKFSLDALFEAATRLGLQVSLESQPNEHEDGFEEDVRFELPDIFAPANTLERPTNQELRALLRPAMHVDGATSIFGVQPERSLAA